MLGATTSPLAAGSWRKSRKSSARRRGNIEHPRAELIISAPAVMGRTHVLPVATEFLRAFPDVRMRLQLTDRYVNLVEEHVDLAVRVGELPDSSMIATRVGSSRLVLCASPAYLKRRGVPKKPADLAAHDCVNHEGNATSNNWEFFTEKTTQTIRVQSRLAVNLGEAEAAAAAEGAGIARVLSYLIDDLVRSRSVVKLLRGYEPSPMPVSVIYPSRRQGGYQLKLRAFWTSICRDWGRWATRRFRTTCFWRVSGHRDGAAIADFNSRIRGTAPQVLFLLVRLLQRAASTAAAISPAARFRAASCRPRDRPRRSPGRGDSASCSTADASPRRAASS